VKKEGARSLSRASQKRKANAEAATANESVNSGSTTASCHTGKATYGDREGLRLTSAEEPWNLLCSVRRFKSGSND
jgi:hypothetical protein